MADAEVTLFITAGDASVDLPVSADSVIDISTAETSVSIPTSNNGVSIEGVPLQEVSVASPSYNADISAIPAFSADPVRPLYTIEVEGYGRLSVPSLFDKKFEQRLYDVATVSELVDILLTALLEFQESVNAADVVSIHPSKVLSELATVTESLSFLLSYGRLFQETGVVSEDVTLQWNIVRNFLENAVLTEQLSFYTDKSLADTVNASEVFQRAVDYSRAYNDTATLTELVSIVLAFVYNVVEAAVTTESVLVEMLKNTKETAIATEIGKINTQDYAEDYFLEDYAGTNTTF